MLLSVARTLKVLRDLSLFLAFASSFFFSSFFFLSSSFCCFFCSLDSLTHTHTHNYVSAHTNKNCSWKLNYCRTLVYNRKHIVYIPCHVGVFTHFCLRSRVGEVLGVSEFCEDERGRGRVVTDGAPGELR